MTFALRGFQAGDLEDLAALTRIATPRDQVSVARLAENVLLEPSFRPEHLVVAEDGGTRDGAGDRAEIIGFLYATQAEHGVPHWPEDGFLTLAAVHPHHHGRGVGSAMLDRALALLRARGVRRVSVAGYPQAYFVPGLDRDQYPEAARLLEDHGFTTRSTPAAMHLDLDAFITPDAVHELEERRVADGYRFARARWDDLPELITFASERLAPDWGPVARAAVLRDRRGPDRIQIARDPQGAVAGFAMYGAYEDMLERFGPFGVDEAQRRTGLGRILLHRTLGSMRAEGAHGAWFLWTGEDDPAGRLYRSTGFEVVRRFDVMRAEV